MRGRWRPALLLAAAVAPAAAAPRVVIDGVFDDWSEVEPGLVAAGGPGAPLGLERLSWTDDPGALYLRIELAREVLLQGLEGSASVLLDADGDGATGATVRGLRGVDLAIVFSPPDPEWRHGARGIGLRRFTAEGAQDLSSYRAGVVVAPTHASREVELRIQRGEAPGLGSLLTGATVGVALLATAADGSPAGATGLSFHRFSSPATPERHRLRDGGSVARTAGTELRVVSWNVAGESLLRRLTAFRRTLAALGPDLVLLDEVPPAASATELLPLFADLMGQDRRGWQVLVGEGGGRQRGVVAGRHRLTRLPAFDRVAYPEGFPAWLAEVDRPWAREDLADAATEGVSAFGALVERDRLRLGAVTVDLQCCGRLGEPEDRLREIQAEAVRRALLKAGGELDALIVAGDLNLVAGRRPLDLLLAGTAPGGGDLTAALPLQLDGASAATWGFSGPFPPSRLDYFLYSGDSLELLRAFVFDTRDLGPVERDALGLRRRDSQVLSGHLPLVVDLRRRGAG